MTHATSGVIQRLTQHNTVDKVEPAAVLREMLNDKQAVDLSGNRLKVTGSITQSEAQFMMEIIKKRKLATCVETGVAFGVSTVAICQALAELESTGLQCKHVGVDPCQYSEFNGAAIAALRRCGLDHLFELMEGPSHVMLPKLLERGMTADMVFVDGWHTFDYTLIDVFLGDKLLRPGGVLMVHDIPMPSKRKVLGYLRTHRKYRKLPGPPRCSLSRRLLSCGRETLQMRSLQGLAYLTHGNLFVAKKTQQYEPPHNFFRRF